MKFISFVAVALLCIFANSSLLSQTFYVFDVDASEFPLVKAKFYAFTQKDSLLIDFKKSNFSVHEDGIEREVTSIYCKPNRKLNNSVVLSIDISSSMKENERIVKETANHLIMAFRMPPNEMAIQTANSTALIVRDFSTDKQELSDDIAAIKIEGGNDFVEHLLNPRTGLFRVAKAGKYNPVTILLTDAYWGALSDEDIQRSIDTCKAYGITFYPVFFSPKNDLLSGIETSLKEIAVRVGGWTYYDIIELEAALDFVDSISTIINHQDPCEIEWISGPGCSDLKTVAVRLKTINRIAELQYYTDDGDLPYLDFSPVNIKFYETPIGTTRDTTITVTAVNGGFEVDNIVSSDPQFKMTPRSFYLFEGQSKELRIEYTPTGLINSFAKFEFITDLCPAYYRAYGLIKDTIPDYEHNPLFLTYPNGGERFIVGSDSIAAWDGIPADEFVRLDYSTNGGENWALITDSASGLKHYFTVPDEVSDSCLMRVTQTSARKDTLLVRKSDLIFENNSFDRNRDQLLFWSPDGDWIINNFGGNSIYSTVEIKNKAGTVFRQIDRSGFAKVSPDGFQLAARKVSDNRRFEDIYLYDFPELTIIDSLEFPGRHITNFDWSPDGNFMAIPASDTLIIYDIGQKQAVYEINCNDIIHTARWSSDGKYILVIFEQGNAKIIDYATKEIDDDFLFAEDYTGDFEWHNSKNLIASASNSAYGSKVFDINSRTAVEQYAKASQATWSPDGSYIAFAAVLSMNIFDRKGILVLSRPHYGYNVKHNHDIRWSPAGNNIIIGSDNVDFAMVYMYGLEHLTFFPLSDVSDSLWSIVKPEIEAKDIVFGQVLVNGFRDSLVNPFVVNIGNWPAKINSITIAGWEADQFRLVSGFPPYEIGPGGSQVAEFRFSPTSEGTKTATIVISTSFATLRYKISGEAVMPKFEVVAKLIDFGKVRVGGSRDTSLVVLQNISPADVTIDSTVMLGPDTEQYAILDGGGAFSFADNHPMTIEFAPAELGRTSGQIGFYHSGLGSPAIAVLYGEGVMHPIITAGRPDFDYLVCENMTSDSIIIRNEGQVPLIIFDASISGTDENDFKLLTDLTDRIINPNDSLACEIGFRPQVAGEKNAELIIKSNAEPDSTFIIALAGRKDIIGLAMPGGTIDLGAICPNNHRDSTILIKNISSIPAKFDMPEISKPFLIFGDNPFDSPFAVNEERGLNIRFEGMDTPGIYRQTISIRDSCGNSKEMDIKIEVMDFPVLYSGSNDFGNVLLKSRKDTVLTISNTSETNIDILSIELQNNSGIFSLKDTYSYPISMPSGQSFDINIDFLPAELRDYSDGIEIEFGRPCSQIINLAVEGSAVLNTVAWLPDTTSVSGAEDFVIPVRAKITGFEEDTLLAGQSYTAELMFHALAFRPSDLSKVRYENNNAIVSIAGGGISISNDTSLIYELAGTVLMPQERITPIYFRSFQWNNKHLVADTISGSIYNTVCAIDLSQIRLFEPATLRISPNPAAEYVSISIRTQEVGLHQLFLYSTEGVLVHKVVFDKTDSKEVSIYNQDINFLDISSGMYRLILRTPMQVISEELAIIK